jgi:hypothetical protein
LSPIALIPASRPVIVPSINGGGFGFISSPGTNGLSTGPADQSVAQHGIARKVPINRANAVRTERKQNTITPYLLEILPGNGHDGRVSAEGSPLGCPYL